MRNGFLPWFWINVVLFYSEEETALKLLCPWEAVWHSESTPFTCQKLEDEFHYPVSWLNSPLLFPGEIRGWWPTWEGASNQERMKMKVSLSSKAIRAPAALLALGGMFFSAAYPLASTSLRYLHASPAWRATGRSLAVSHPRKPRNRWLLLIAVNPDQMSSFSPLTHPAGQSGNTHSTDEETEVQSFTQGHAVI